MKLVGLKLAELELVEHEFMLALFQQLLSLLQPQAVFVVLVVSVVLQVVLVAQVVLSLAQLALVTPFWLRVFIIVLFIPSFLTSLVIQAISFYSLP